MGNKGEGIAGLCRPAGPADRVGVGIGGIGDVIVDDMGDPGNVNAPGGNVGGHEDLVPAVPEPVERRLALVLGQVSLQRCGAGRPTLFQLIPPRAWHGAW